MNFNMDDRPLRNGWAPGHYHGICHTCCKEYVGDKRSITCADCAYSEKDAPSEKFDISDYEFSDCDIESVEIDGYANNEYLHFDFKQETNELTHSKDDVIAMAKALKLTADDLK